MTEFLLWARFLGAWLLFAGPIYQSALELREESLEREELAVASAAAPEPPEVSPWWWLIPPIGFWLQRRRNRAWRKQMLAVLTPRQVEALVTFIDKATGWLMVAGGGLLIAADDTWKVAEHEEWGHAGFWPLAVIAAGLAVGHVTYRLRRSNAVRARIAGTGNDRSAS